jgi:hypothetical protein
VISATTSSDGDSVATTYEQLRGHIAPPPRPLVTQDDFDDHDPATIQRILRSSLDRRR